MDVGNSNFCEFENLFHCCSTILTQQLTIGQEKSDMTIMTYFLLFCLSWKLQQIGIQWVEFLKKGPTLQRLFSHDLSPFLCEKYIINYYAKLLMRTLEKKQKSKLSMHSLCHRCSFPQTNHLSGALLEGKLYVIRKHKLYGYRREVFVTPTGKAIDIMSQKPWTISDLVIFQGNSDFHQKALAKQINNSHDTSLLAIRYPDNWAVLLDKGYQDSWQYLWAIIPKTKPHEKLLYCWGWILECISCKWFFNSWKFLDFLHIYGVLYRQNTGGKKKGMVTSFKFVLRWQNFLSAFTLFVMMKMQITISFTK